MDILCDLAYACVFHSWYFKIYIKPPLKKKILLLKMVITYYFGHSGKCPRWLNCLIFAKFYIYRRAANTNKHCTHRRPRLRMRVSLFPGHKLGAVRLRTTWKATRISSASACFLPDLYRNVGNARENCGLSNIRKGLCLHIQHTETSTIDYPNFEKCFFLLRKGFKPIVHMRFWVQTSAPKQRCKKWNFVTGCSGTYFKCSMQQTEAED